MLNTHIASIHKRFMCAVDTRTFSQPLNFARTFIVVLYYGHIHIYKSKTPFTLYS